MLLPPLLLRRLRLMCHENIDESIRKVMDIMVDKQLKQGEAALHELESIKGSKVWTNCHAYVADALSK